MILKILQCKRSFVLVLSRGEGVRRPSLAVAVVSSERGATSVRSFSKPRPLLPFRDPLCKELCCTWLLLRNDDSSPKISVVLAAVGNRFLTPDLTKIQTVSYAAFLQDETPAEKRKDQGLEGVLREIFPIESYDKQISLEYHRYELGKPRYTPDECRQLRLTYGRPFRVMLRLNKEEPYEEEVYLGDLPIMLGGGEFIINGAERVVVSQLHRSPGVDFVLEQDGTSDRKLPSCRIIPERGSWIEINITKKDTLSVRIDQSGKFSAITLLRAMSPQYSTDADIIRAFYETSHEKIVDGRSAAKIVGKIAVDDIVYPRPATGRAKSSSKPARRSPRTRPKRSARPV